MSEREIKKMKERCAPVGERNTHIRREGETRERRGVREMNEASRETKKTGLEEPHAVEQKME